MDAVQDEPGWYRPVQSDRFRSLISNDFKNGEDGDPRDRLNFMQEIDIESVPVWTPEILFELYDAYSGIANHLKYVAWGFDNLVSNINMDDEAGCLCIHEIDDEVNGFKKNLTSLHRYATITLNVMKKLYEESMEMSSEPDPAMDESFVVSAAREMMDCYEAFEFVRISELIIEDYERCGIQRILYDYMDIFEIPYTKPVMLEQVDEFGDQCPICMEVTEDGEVVCALPCEHIFHYNCLMSWLNVKRSCPMCRAEY